MIIWGLCGVLSPHGYLDPTSIKQAYTPDKVCAVHDLKLHRAQTPSNRGGERMGRDHMICWIFVVVAIGIFNLRRLRLLWDLLDRVNY